MTQTDREFAASIRRDMPDDAELRASLKLHGWHPELPGIQDEHGNVLVGNRRLKIATELGIAPVLKTLEFGEGKEADAERIRLALVSNIGAAPLSPADRKRIAEYLYGERQWTMQRIAEALTVSIGTVSGDLGGFSMSEKPSRPKGGRPKGSGRKPRPRKNTEAAEQLAAKLVLDEGKSLRQAAAEAGLAGTEQVVKVAVAREQGRRELHVEASDLSPSAREKADAYLRRREREIKVECEQAAREQAQKWYREALDRYLPEVEKREKQARMVLDRHRGIMPRDKYAKLLKAVHRDRKNAVTDRELDEALVILRDYEPALVSREKPLPELHIPKSWQEWEAAREAVRRQNSERAKKAHAARKDGSPARR